MRYLVIFAVCGLSACVPAEPIVSDFNGDSVKIQVSQLSDEAEAGAKSLAEANRICGTRGRKAEYVSTLRDSQNYVSEHLYLCL